MKKIFLVFVLLFAELLLCCQIVPFQKIIETTFNDEASKVIQVNDRYYFIIKTDGKAGLISMDIDGKIIWTNKVEKNSGWADILYDEGRIIAVGFEKENESVPNVSMLGIFDANTGQEILLETYDIETGLRDFFIDIVKNPKPSNPKFPYYITNRAIFSSSSLSENINLITIDINGKIGSSIQIGDGNNDFENANMIELNNGDILLYGAYFDSNSKGCLARINNVGKVLSIFNINNSYFFTHHIKIDDNNILFFGLTRNFTNSAIVIKYENGEIKYIQELPQLSNINSAYKISENNYRVLGKANINLGGTSDLVIMNVEETADKNNFIIKESYKLAFEEVQVLNGFASKSYEGNVYTLTSNSPKITNQFVSIVANKNDEFECIEKIPFPITQKKVSPIKKNLNVSHKNMALPKPEMKASNIISYLQRQFCKCKDTLYQTLNFELCDNPSISVNNISYSDEGVYNQTFLTQNLCDSILIINVKLNPIKDTVLTYSICPNDTVNINNQSYTTSGLFFQNIKTRNGCDSNLQIQISLIDSPDPSFAYILDTCTNYIEIKPKTPNGKLSILGIVNNEYIEISGLKSFLPRLGKYRILYELNKNSFCSNESEIEIEVLDPIVLPFNIYYFPTEICEGDDVNLVTSLGSEYIKKWKVNNVEVEGSLDNLTIKAERDFEVNIVGEKKGCLVENRINVKVGKYEDSDFSFIIDSCLYILNLKPYNPIGIFSADSLDDIDRLDSFRYQLKNKGAWTINYTINKGSKCETNTYKKIELNNEQSENTLPLPNIFKYSGNISDVNSKLCFYHKEPQFIETFEWKIYDRWGNLCYKSNEKLECWDGTINNKVAETGVYTYIINYIENNCISKSKILRGSVTLIK